MISGVRAFWKIFVLLLLALLVSWHTLLYPIGRDQGFFAYAAKLMLSGEKPYLGFWDVKPPLIYLLYALNFTILGKSIAAIRAFDLIWQILTALFAGLLAARIAGRDKLKYVVPVLYLYCYYTLIIPYWVEAQPDGYLILPVVLGIFLATSDRHRSWLASGACFGFAFWMKYHSIAYILPLLPLAIGDRRTILKRASLWVVGFLIPSAAVLAYLSATGALSEFLKIELVIAPRYTGLDLTSGNLARFLSRLSQVQMPPYVGPMLWLCAIAGLVLSRARARRVYGLLVASGLLFVLLQAKLFSYHHLPLVASLSIPAGIGLVEIAANRRTRAWAAALGLSFLVLAAITLELRAKNLGPDLAVPLGPKTLEQRYVELGGIRRGQGDFSFEASMELARYIEANTSADEPIFIWGFEPVVYFLSDRDPPTRFIMNTPLFGAMAHAEYIEELLDDLEKNPPVYFVVATGDALIWVRGTSEDSLAALAEMPKLRGFLEGRYEYACRVADYEVFRLRR